MRDEGMRGRRKQTISLYSFQQALSLKGATETIRRTCMKLEIIKSEQWSTLLVAAFIKIRVVFVLRMKRNIPPLEI